MGNFSCLGGLLSRQKARQRGSTVTRNIPEETSVEVVRAVEKEKEGGDAVDTEAEVVEKAGEAVEKPHEEVCSVEETVSVVRKEGGDEVAKDAASMGDGLVDNVNKEGLEDVKKEVLVEEEPKQCEEEAGTSAKDQKGGPQDVVQDVIVLVEDKNDVRKPEPEAKKREERSTPANPVTFLKAVIDDVQLWQAQVAGIKPSSDQCSSSSQSSDTMHQFIQASMNRLQSRNEELSGKVKYLSQELEKSKEERVKLEEVVDKITSYKARLEEELTKYHQMQPNGNTACTSERRESGPQSIPIPDSYDSNCSAVEASTSKAIALRHRTSSPDTAQSSLQQHIAGMHMEGDIALKNLASCVSKEDYFMTQNKCLKMWLATMQGSIAQMETEVQSLKRDKAKLLDHIKHSKSDPNLSTNVAHDRQAGLPLPPEFHPNMGTSGEIMGTKSPKASSVPNSALHRLASQNSRISRNTRWTSTLRRGHAPNMRTMSPNQSGSTGSLIPSSDYSGRYLNFKPFPGSNTWSSTRTTPSWKP